MTMTESRAMGFWRRQFADEVTARQVAFDVAAGVILPAVCLWFDPIVFQSSHALLAGHWLAGYGAIGLGMVALAWHLLIGWPQPVVAGALAAAALVALGFGLVLLPFSLIGILLYGLGLLGLVPFATAFACVRNAVRAWRAANVRVGDRLLVKALAVAGCLALLAAPVVGERSINNRTRLAIERIAGGHPDEVQRGMKTLQRLRPVANYDLLVVAHYNETDEARQERVEKAYHELTGEDLLYRSLELYD